MVVARVAGEAWWMQDAMVGYGKERSIGPPLKELPRLGILSKSSKMARNGSNTSPKGYSGPPESIPKVSGRSDFLPF